MHEKNFKNYYYFSTLMTYYHCAHIGYSYTSKSPPTVWLIEETKRPHLLLVSISVEILKDQVLREQKKDKILFWIYKQYIMNWLSSIVHFGTWVMLHLNKNVLQNSSRSLTAVCFLSLHGIISNAFLLLFLLFGAAFGDILVTLSLFTIGKDTKRGTAHRHPYKR